MTDEERHPLECEYEPGKFYRFTSMWGKHCLGDAASRRGMSLEEYIQEELYYEQNPEAERSD
tara:strand:- start:184 stop:369 length:186 start_codon:yes stop_codon:yes gene_type:complete